MDSLPDPRPLQRPAPAPFPPAWPLVIAESCSFLRPIFSVHGGPGAAPVSSQSWDLIGPRGRWGTQRRPLAGRLPEEDDDEHGEGRGGGDGPPHQAPPERLPCALPKPALQTKLGSPGLTSVGGEQGSQPGRRPPSPLCRLPPCPPESGGGRPPSSAPRAGPCLGLRGSPPQGAQLLPPTGAWAAGVRRSALWAGPWEGCETFS